jgi:hypothetical protein
MNKLNPEHLHLLLDEPIYVLNDHFEDPAEASPEIIQETEQVVDFKGENKKGILIISQETFVEEDEEFLFKGLNALNIFAEDVAIVYMQPDLKVSEIKHTKRLIFAANAAEESLYQIKTIDNIAQLSCHSINQIRNNQDLKKSFWLGLKAVFE